MIIAASDKIATNIPANAPEELFSELVEPIIRSVTGSSQFSPEKQIGL